MKNIYEMIMTETKNNVGTFPGARRKLVMCSVVLLVSLFAGTQAGAAVITNTTLAALNSAISSASSNDVLVLADGTYTTTTTLTVGKSGVTVRPATPGGAYLNNITAININGDNITFSGFQFTSRTIATNGIIITVNGSRNLLTQLNFDGYQAEKYINLTSSGRSNEVSYCNFRNKPVTAQQGNLIHVALTAGSPGYHKIRYNSFQDMPGAGGDNGNECIRLENGAQYTLVGRSVVEFNYFNNTGLGDSEVISVKCRENVLRYNTMTNNLQGNFCFRNGDSNIAYGNFFIKSGGIRVKEANNIYCYNNYMENCGDGSITAPIKYVYVSPNLKNINFFHNTIVGGTSVELDTGATGNTFANNIFSNTTASKIFTGSASGIKWVGNQYSGTLGITISSGMTKTNSLLVRNSTGYYVPASNSPAIDASSTNYPAILDIANIDDDPSLLLDISGKPRPASLILKDVGCSEYTNGAAFNHPLALTDVGPSYLGGPSSGNVAPSVSLTAPTNNASFTAPASITMTATATDTDGTVTSVDFYNGATLLGSDATSPYAYTWTNVAAGSYSLTARATDNGGAISTSAVVTVTVLDPVCTLTVNNGTGGGGSYTNGTQVAIAANAPAAGKAFDRWIGDTQYVNNVTYTNALVTMSTNNVSLTATYKDITYTLTINGGTGSGAYTNGTKALIMAGAPAAGKAFDKWIGDTQYLDSASSIVTMPAQAITLTATYKDITYTLTVTSGTGSGSYTNGQQVAIAANTPADGKIFDHWIGDTQYVNNVSNMSAIVTMSTNAVSLTATYTDFLTVINGIIVGWYANGTVAGIAANDTRPGVSFRAWTGATQYVANVTASNTTVTMPAYAITLTATYNYALTIITGSGSGWYTNNAQVAITASNLTGKAFDHWSGDTQLVNNVTYTNALVTLSTNPASLTATCVDIQYILTINGGTGSGAYTNGTKVPIAAGAPPEGQVLLWTGDTQYLDSVSSIVTMPATNVTLTATYTGTAVTLTGQGSAGGSVSPTSTNMIPGYPATFVITASNYYRISAVFTNGGNIGVAFNNNSTNYTFVWSNVTAVGTVTVAFVQQITTNAPAPVPYSWLASYGLTNSGATFDQAATSDPDGDGLTVWQEYIAGTDPTNGTSCLKATQTTARSNLNVIAWTAQSNRVYSVYWSTNLVKGFTALNTNIPYTQSSYTNAAPDSRANYYQIKVRLQ